MDRIQVGNRLIPLYNSRGDDLSPARLSVHVDIVENKPEPVTPIQVQAKRKLSSIRRSSLRRSSKSIKVKSKKKCDFCGNNSCDYPI